MDGQADGHEPPGRDAPGLRRRLRYRFDNLLARGTSATLIWLAAVTGLAVLISSFLLAIAGVAFSGGAQDNWFEDVWQSLLRVLDPGTMAGDVGWGRRLLALLITIFGLLVAGTLIGIIAAGVEDRIDDMRRARSVVIESDHIVVLGGSDRLPVLLQQLAMAAAAGGCSTIVVLADLDPAEIHAAARHASTDRGRVRIVCRSGDPTVPEDLALVRLSEARSVVVLSDGESDLTAIETVVAVAAEMGRFDDMTVVVELLEADSARRLQRAYGSAIHPIVTAEAVARTMAFALRQRGLGRLVAELLDFRGSDLHIVENTDYVGVTFGDLVRCLANARPLGLQRADGRIELCPPFDTTLGEDDLLIVIAASRRGFQYVARDGQAPELAASHSTRQVAIEERLVVSGWNDLGEHLLVGWANWAAPSSLVEVVVDPRWIDPDSIRLPDLGRVSITQVVSDDVIRHISGTDPTTVVLLAAPGGDDGADIHTILDLHTLRQELAGQGGPRPRLVVELRDAAHATMVDLAGPDDLVISDAMGSQFLAQLVDQPARRDVLLAVYSTDGASLRLVPCDQFDLVGVLVVSEIVDRVAAGGLVVIGWRRVADHGAVTLSPHLAATVDLGPADDLVVIG